MKTRILLGLWVVVGSCAASLVAQVPSARLDPAVLGKPPVDAWPTYHGDYSGRRYSTLKEINTANVKNLTLAWVYRLNTARNASRIVVVDEGLIVEDGSHDELVAQGGRYAALWDAFDHAATTAPCRARRSAHHGRGCRPPSRG